MRYIEYTYTNINDGIEHESHEYFDELEFDEKKTRAELEAEGLELIVSYLTESRIGRIFSKTDNPEELRVTITKDSFVDLFDFKKKRLEEEIRLYGSTRHDEWMDNVFQSFRNDE